MTVENAPIECMECHARTHAIKVHLQKDHGPKSKMPMTYGEYRDKYPKAPLLSARAIAELEKREKKVAPSDAFAIKAKAPMSELFGIATSVLGKDVEIPICQQEGYEKLIPKYKDNYVYDVDTLKTIVMAFEENRPFYLYGDAGLGKTSIIFQVCSATRRRCIRMQHRVGMEEADITGRWVVRKDVDDNGNAYSVMQFQLGPLAQCMLNGWTYLADEYDRAPPGVMSVYQAVLEGSSPLHIPEAPEEFQFIEPHPEFRFCATGNTNGSGDDCGLYSATIVQDAATMDRLNPIIRMSYMPEEQEALVLQGTAPVKKLDAERLVRFAKKTREMFPQQLGVPMSPRSLIHAAEIGLMKGNFVKGIELCYANRLPLDERRTALEVAQREFGAQP